MRLRSLSWAVCASLGAAAASSSLLQTPLPLHVSSMLPPRSNVSVEESCCQASAHLQELLSLSELPMERLLRVQVAMRPLTSALQHRGGQPAEEDLPEAQPQHGDASAEALPQAEALRSRPRSRRPPPMPRGDIIDTGSTLGTKQSKLATGFQLAITVLSFLAFGAYLISLVVSIVRNNNTSTTTATTQQPFVLVPAQAGKRRRRRRYAEPAWEPPGLPEPDRVFSAITAVAKAYARFEGHHLDL